MLNEDQQSAFDTLKAFVCGSSEDIYVIKGWAGTGKTFCVSLLVKYVLEILHPTKA